MPNKKSIYLDQMVISEFLNNLDPTINKSKLDNFYAALFFKVQRLVKLQLIAVPFSDVHEDESLVSKYAGQLEALMDLLGSNQQFHSTVEVQDMQFRDCVDHVLGLEYNRRLSKENVVHGTLNQWTNRLNLSVHLLRHVPGIKEETEALRSESSIALASLSEFYRSQQGKSPEYWFNYELASFRNTLLSEFSRLKETPKTVTLDGYSVSVPVKRTRALGILDVIFDAMLYRGVEKKQFEDVLTSIVSDVNLKTIPHLLIGCHLYAMFASSNLKPDRGMYSDIKMLSCYAPYCSAMFVDRKAGNLLHAYDKRDPSFSTKIFSRNSGAALLDYLDGIESDAGPKHIELISEVYGEAWLAPFVPNF